MKLSIITVNLNNLSGLKQTLESIFTQTYHHLESIVIDGGSIDGSKEYVANHQDKIAYWVSQRDNGIYEAMNKGILKSTGDRVLFLNSGDYLLRTTCLEEFFKKPLKAEITIGDAKRLNNRNQVEDYIQPDKVDAQFFYRYSLCHQSMIYDKKLFDRLGLFNENNRIVSDWEFNLKALIVHSCSYEHRKIPLVYYDTSGQSSNLIKIRDQERDNILQKIFSPKELEILAEHQKFRYSFVGRAK